MGAAASDYFTQYADVQYGFLDDELAILNLHELAAKGDFHRVSICLKKGLDPNRPSFDDDDEYAREDTPMICAARGNSVRRGHKQHLQTLEVLFHFGGDVNKHNYLEQTPLYIACEKNLLTIVQWLVTHGSDVNKSSKVGVSPLLCAYRNGNAAIVQMLVDHGAKVIDPPRDFCSIKFPTIVKELRGEYVDERIDSEDRSDASSENDDVTARPLSSFLRFRPQWKVLETIRPTTAARPETTDSSTLAVRQSIEAQHERQQQQRDAILHDLEEQRRIQEQRKYRQKMAIDNAKRKTKRRLQREKAQYDKYIALVEKRREQQLVPLRAVTRHGTRATTAPVTVIGLQWNKELSPTDDVRRNLHTAPSRMGRPSWTAHDVCTTQQATIIARHDGDDTLHQQSRVVFDALQAKRDRQERLRQVYAAPGSSLPPLRRRNESMGPESVA